MLLTTGVSLLATVAAHAQAPDMPNDAKAFLQANPPPSKMKGHYKLVTIGELLYSHPMPNSSDQDFQAVAKLVRDGDVAIAEQEGPFLDLARFKGVPGIMRAVRLRSGPRSISKAPSASSV